MQVLFSAMSGNLGLPCAVPVRKPPESAQKPTTPRRVVARAFGQFLRIARERHHWSQGAVAELCAVDAEKQVGVKVSGTFISHVEQGKVAAPDPVLLRELARLYGVNFEDLIQLLQRSRQQPAVGLESLVEPGGAEMVVRGEDEYLVTRYRGLTPSQRVMLMKFLDMIQSGQGGAADSVAQFPHPRHPKR
jgi:transcriptional regulator with XRE-family HTH domain